MLSLMASAFSLGAMHALTPGHGKTIMGAYLIGSRGRIIDAIILGLIVTITHTSGVLLLGVLSTVASHYFMPERIQVYTSLIAGFIILAFGIWLCYKRLGTLLHGHDHSHGHSHSPYHSHHNDKNAPHSHEPPHNHHHHENSRRPTLGVLAGLGISGGIVPCPEAFAILLAAISKGMIAGGIVLVLTFSLGLAVVLIGIGIGIIKSGDFLLKRTGVQSSQRIGLVVGMLSSAVITVLGIYLTADALKRVV